MLIRTFFEMSQLRRQIAVGAIIAILSAVGLGLGANLLVPSQVASSTTASTFSTATSTATTTFVSSSSGTLTTSSGISSSSTSTGTTTATATQTSTATYTSTASSVTTPTPSLGVNPTVQLDPSLGVSPARSVLLSANATQIAEQLASVLGESPVTSTGVVLPHGPNDSILAHQATYNFSTSSGSRITITFIQDVFYQLDYVSGVKGAQSTATFTPLNATAAALKILAGMGVPTRTDRLMVQAENLISSQDYLFQWAPAYAGIPISGTLVKNFDGSNVIQGNSVYFEFNPRSGSPTRIILISPYWYTVGDGFPLTISPLQATNIAATFAMGLGMSDINNPQVNFVVVHNSLYYAITIGNSAQQFELIVNPRTGEVGLPG